MSRTSRITALYERLSRDDDLGSGIAALRRVTAILVVAYRAEKAVPFRHDRGSTDFAVDDFTNFTCHNSLLL